MLIVSSSATGSCVFVSSRISYPSTISWWANEGEEDDDKGDHEGGEEENDED